METFKARENFSDSSFREDSSDNGKREPKRRIIGHRMGFFQLVFIKKNEIILV